MSAVTRVAVVILALVLTASCTYLPTLPTRNDGPQQINPPVPRLP